MKAITGEPMPLLFLPQKSLHSKDCTALMLLVENKCEGGLHSGKMVMALQNKIRSLGGQIMQGAESRKDGKKMMQK